MVSAKVSSTIRELKALPIPELLALPDCTISTFDTEGKEQSLGVYHETTKDGGALIVAQCKNTHFLGVGNVYVEAFLITESGEIAEAPENLLWQYT